MWNELFIAWAGGALGTLTTLIGYVLKNRSSQRADWWRRFEWAAETVVSSDPRQRDAARVVLEDLSEDPIATAADRDAAEALLRSDIHLLSATSRESRTRV